MTWKADSGTHLALVEKPFGESPKSLLIFALLASHLVDVSAVSSRSFWSLDLRKPMCGGHGAPLAWRRARLPVLAGEEVFVACQAYKLGFDSVSRVSASGYRYRHDAVR